MKKVDARQITKRGEGDGSLHVIERESAEQEDVIFAAVPFMRRRIFKK
jgi:hypothetical protein